MTRFLGYAVFLTMILIAVPAYQAEAQINPFRNSAVEDLTEKDLELMGAAAVPLYKTEKPEIGKSAAWTNPDSGNFGTIELVDVYVWRKMPCRKLQHLMQIKKQRDALNISIDRCQVESGEWKIRF